MVNSIEIHTISDNDVEPLSHDIDQSVDWEIIIYVIQDFFTTINDALIGLQTQISFEK